MSSFLEVSCKDQRVLREWTVTTDDHNLLSQKMSKRQKDAPHDTLESQAKALFEQSFQGRKPLATARAPGRVNLIGEHTDYSEGFCFPMALSLATVCCIGRAPEGSKECVLVSVQSPAGSRVTFVPGENAKEEWGKYAAGVAAQYGLDFPIEAAFASDVPLGGGLSSSAALDVSFATALEQVIDPARKWDPSERALKCVEGDHTFVGVVSHLHSSYSDARLMCI